MYLAYDFRYGSPKSLTLLILGPWIMKVKACSEVSLPHGR